MSKYQASTQTLIRIGLRILNCELTEENVDLFISACNELNLLYDYRVWTPNDRLILKLMI